MKKAIVLLVCILAGCQTTRTEKVECKQDMNINHVVTVSNLAATPLRCFKANCGTDDWTITTEIQIGPQSSKKIQMCSYEDYLACSLFIDGRSSTFLTYFKPYLPGVYKITLQDVPCEDCESSKTKKGTVVELPSGEIIDKWYQ